MKVNDYIALIFQCHDNHVEFRGFVHVCGGHIPMAIPLSSGCLWRRREHCVLVEES